MKETGEQEEYIYAHWLMTLSGVSRAKKVKMLKAVDSAKEVYTFTEKRLENYDIGNKGIERWQQHKKDLPQQMWEKYKLQNGELKFTYYGAKDYPKRLYNISDAPFGLYYIGELPEDEIPSVAIIGARNNSEYGRCMAEYFAKGLAKAKVNIISGMAIGIDGIGQRIALREGTKSFGILGSGVDVIYPNNNAKLYYQLIKQGGVISESLPGTLPYAGLFPQRNRIISGLADVVLVIEAREKSGTLITVDMALEQGKEVYVVPGRCTDSLSVGCNNLLRQGAGAAISPEDILQDMGWKNLNKISKTENVHEIIAKKQTSLITELSDISAQILTILDLTPCTQEDIVKKLREKDCGETVPQILQGILELEMQGIAIRQGGQYSLNTTKL